MTAKVTKQNREQVIAEYIDRILESMDIDALMDYARSGLEATYSHYKNEELEDEIDERYEESFPWDNFEWADE